MKIAVCISGHLRHYYLLKDNFDLFINILKMYGDVDVFVATWNKQNTVNCWSKDMQNLEAANNNINLEEIKTHFNPLKIHISDYDFYSSDFSPIKYKDITDNTYNFDSNGIGGEVVNSSKMYYLVYQANILKKEQEYSNQKEYDLVIRTRPDYEYNIDVINRLNFNLVESNTIYASTFGAVLGAKLEDQFGYGDSKTMDRYSACYLKMAAPFNIGVFGNPENILTHTLLGFHNINIKYIERPGLLGSDITNIKR